MTTTIRRVTVGAVELEIAEAGIGGRPLLMVHGFSGAKEDFGDWWDQLADRGWHVVAPDLRGHGASDHPTGRDDYGLDVFEADVTALVDQLGWDRFVLVGHSMGGMIGQSIAIHHPERLDGLVLMDTVADAPKMEGGGVQMAIVKIVVRVFGMNAMARFLRKPPPGSPESVRHLYETRPGYADWAQKKIRDTSPVMARVVMAELPRRPDLVPALGALDVPALVIVGEHDMPGFEEGSRRMAAAIPGSTFVLLAGAAHSPQLETPAAWWEALTAFLDPLARSLSVDGEAEGTN